MDLSNTVADEENLSEDSSGGEIECDEEIESKDSESDKMEFDDEEFNTKDLSEDDESSMVTPYQNKDEHRDDDNLFPNKNDVAVKNKKSYTIEYEWKVQNSEILSNNSNSNDIDDRDIQNLEINGDQATKKQNGDKSSERRRRKRERKDVTRTPNYNDWLPTHKIAESTDKNKTECIVQYRNNMSEMSANNIQSDAQTEHKTKSDDQPKKKKRKPRTRRIYSCDLCNKIFKKSSHLIRHVRTHTGEKPFSCGICGDSFSLNSILKSHMLIHTQEKPFSCDLCELRFSRSGDLKSHRRVHTGEKPYQCLFCGRFFRQSGVLKKHERIHTGEKPYTCTICGRSFRQNGDAQKHIRTHTGEKPFECHICGKEFARNNDMQTHVRRHTGEKPYSCGVCSKSFVDNCGLRRHMKIHTRDLKIPRIPELKSKKPKKQKTEILVPSASELMLGIKPGLLSRLRPELFLIPKTLDTSEIISKQVTEPIQEISEKSAKVSSKEISKQSKVNSQLEQSPISLFSISEEFGPEQFEETNTEDSDIESLPLPDSSPELQTNHIASAFHSGYQELYSSPKPDIFSGPNYEPFLKIKTTQLMEAVPEQISENLELSQKTELEQRHYSSSDPISERPVDYTVQQSTELISNVSTHTRPLKLFPEDYHHEHDDQQFPMSTTKMYAGSDISAKFRVQRLQDSRSKQFLEKSPGVNVREQFLASTPEMYGSAMPSPLPNHLPEFYLKQQLMTDKLLDSRHQQSSATIPNFSADSKLDTNYDQTSSEQHSRPTHELCAGICRLYPKPKPAVFPDPY